MVQNVELRTWLYNNREMFTFVGHVHIMSLQLPTISDGWYETAGKISLNGCLEKAFEVT